MCDEAIDIISLYEQNADHWDSVRGRSLVEKDWLDRFLTLVPPSSDILDLGCGNGVPIARYISENGHHVTGVDAASTMIDLCRVRLPDQTWIVGDMRDLSIPRKFSGILAWNSFLHLPHDDQRRMFDVFSRHATNGTALMFTSGTAHGTSIGEFRGKPLYHASLAPAEYAQLLQQHGFNLIDHVVEDPDCGLHTVWLSQFGK